MTTRRPDEDLAAQLAVDIPPALTRNEWANVRANPNAQSTFVEFARDVGRTPAVIALANYYLHDEDPRKLTRDHVELLRRAAELMGGPSALRRFGQPSDAAPTVAAVVAQGELYSQLLELADVIESYLPQAKVIG